MRIAGLRDEHRTLQPERGPAEKMGMRVLVRPLTAHRWIDFSAARHPRRGCVSGSFAGILLLASLACCTTRRTPNVCCTSDTECAQLGLPPGSASEYSCAEGHVCRDFYCVPEPPIVDNGQPAELVLGQETFTTADEHHGGVSARSLQWP